MLRVRGGLVHAARRRCASRQVSRRRSAARATGRRSCGSRALPEARLVVRAQLEPAHPLRALPEVEVRHQQPRRAAVLRRERLAVVAERDPRLAAGDVRERQIGGVAAVAEREHVLGRRLDAVQQRCRARRRASGVELRPLGHAVDVDGDRLARAAPELVPGPAARLVDLAADREAPLSSGVRGVGPAESTGKSWVTYWPGGTRAGSAPSRARPRKPREMCIVSESSHRDGITPTCPCHRPGYADDLDRHSHDARMMWSWTGDISEAGE